MKKKIWKRPLFWVFSAVLIIVITMVIAVLINLPKPLAASDSNINLEAIADGTYQGECDNGLVFAKVDVTVEDHVIVNVHVLEHRNGKGQSAEAIVSSVLDRQSIEVDTISGATASSQTILKAIENALAK